MLKQFEVKRHKANLYMRCLTFTRDDMKASEINSFFAFQAKLNLLAFSFDAFSIQIQSICSTNERTNAAWK